MSDEAADSIDEEPEADAPTEALETAYGCPVSDSLGQRVVHPERDTWLEMAASLYADGFNMCIDLTAVDYLTYAAPRHLPAEVGPQRFEVVIHLLALEERTRVRVRVQVDAADPVVSTLFDLYPGAENMEREVFDMFGIRFEHHPDMTRILMPEDWVGHPLRKDYAVGRIPVQFKTGAEL